MNKDVIHAIQLESYFQWFQATISKEARRTLGTREGWFAAMKRIRCLICEGPIEA